MIGLLVVFLFGSHLVYPEVAAWVAVLTSRLPLREDGRTARLLTGLVPVVLAGALVCALGGVLARAYDTRTAGRRVPALRRTRASAGRESEPDGRTFRWTLRRRRLAAPGRAAGLDGRPPGPQRPSGRPPVALEIWVDDAPRGRVTLPPGAWRRLEVPAGLAGSRSVLRVRAAETFRPARAADRRELGIETGPAPFLRPTAVSLLRIHPYDPRKKSRSLEIGPAGGVVFAAFTLLAGGATALGLFAAPRLVSDLVHASERRAVGETAQRGAEAFASVGRRALALGGRIAADELFLARVAAVIEVARPPGFPATRP